jgi:hypothetical protein
MTQQRLTVGVEVSRVGVHVMRERGEVSTPTHLAHHLVEFATQARHLAQADRVNLCRAEACRRHGAHSGRIHIRATGIHREVPGRRRRCPVRTGNEVAQVPLRWHDLLRDYLGCLFAQLGALRLRDRAAEAREGLEERAHLASRSELNIQCRQRPRDHRPRGDPTQGLALAQANEFLMDPTRVGGHPSQHLFGLSTRVDGTRLQQVNEIVLEATVCLQAGAHSPPAQHWLEHELVLQLVDEQVS